jgi:hypothetical protein
MRCVPELEYPVHQVSRVRKPSTQILCCFIFQLEPSKLHHSLFAWSFSGQVHTCFVYLIQSLTTHIRIPPPQPCHAGTSRNGISLDTGVEKDEHYDQICALSVETINANFDALWEIGPAGVQELVFNDGEHGVLTGTMLAPRLMIDPNQEREGDPFVLFSIRFGPKSNIYYSPKQSQDLSGWVITVKARLEELCVTPIVGDDEETVYEKKRHTKQMKKIFRLVGAGKDGQTKEYELDEPVKIQPGEYSIHRLFAAISGMFHSIVNTIFDSPLTSVTTYRKRLAVCRLGILHFS